MPFPLHPDQHWNSARFTGNHVLLIFVLFPLFPQQVAGAEGCLAGCPLYLAVQRGNRRWSCPWLQPLSPGPGCLSRTSAAENQSGGQEEPEAGELWFFARITFVNKAPSKSSQDNVPCPATSAPNPGPLETVPIKVNSTESHK